MKDATEVSREVLIERWENCLRVLQNLTPHQRRKHWKMSAWGMMTSCGTVACAAGHCALDPWFQRRGLKMKIVVTHDEELGDISDVQFDETMVPVFFGRQGTGNIFYDTTHRSVKTVIREVKAHIKWLQEAPEYNT